MSRLADTTTTRMPETSQQAGPVTLARLIPAHASSTGDRRGLVYAGRTWSYSDLAMSAGALASAMVADRLAGERVALMLPNGPEAVLAYLACFEAGAVATPFNSRYAPPEIEAVLRRARPRWIVAEADRLDRLDLLDPQVLDGVRILVVGDDDRYESLEPLLQGQPLDLPEPPHYPTHRPCCSSRRAPQAQPRASYTATPLRWPCSPALQRHWAM